MTILQRIFNDHWNTVVDSGITIRDTVFDNVQKMLHCGDYNYGYALYICEHCGRFTHVPFVANPAFAPLAGIFTPSNALPRCRSNS